MKRFFKILALLLAAILSLSLLGGCAAAATDLMDALGELSAEYNNNDYSSDNDTQTLPNAPPSESRGGVEENGSYTSKDAVALYINVYGELPPNFITKDEARDLGWDSSKGNLHDVAPGKSIGGNRFGNYEGRLPKASGRVYYECDINYDGGYRGSERIVFSNDGLIYYTADHYETFILLYKDGIKQ